MKTVGTGREYLHVLDTFPPVLRTRGLTIIRQIKNVRRWFFSRSRLSSIHQRNFYMCQSESIKAEKCFHLLFKGRRISLDSRRVLNTLWIALTSLISLNSLQCLWTPSSSRVTLWNLLYPSRCQPLNPSAFRGFFQGHVPRTQTFALNHFVYSWSKVPRWRTTGSVGNLRLVNMIILDLVLINKLPTKASWVVFHVQMKTTLWGIDVQPIQ